MSFEEFKGHLKEGTLKEDAYSFSVENDFWQWEEAESLKGSVVRLEICMCGFCHTRTLPR